MKCILSEEMILNIFLDYYLSDIKESTNKPHHTETTSTIINNHTSTDDV